MGSARAFINVDHETLLGGDLPVLAHHKVALEILENIEPDSEVIDACSNARRQGFMLALDDVDHRLKAGPLLPLANVIKIDFCRTPPDWRRELVSQYGRGETAMLAEKVESAEEFRQARSFGYQYFQGYFFARPDLVVGRPLGDATLNLLRILAELASADVRVSRLEALVKQNVSLSYKLIRYINSGAFSMCESIKSLRHALVLLGMEHLRKLLSCMTVFRFPRQYVPTERADDRSGQTGRKPPPAA